MTARVCLSIALWADVPSLCYELTSFYEFGMKISLPVVSRESPGRCQASSSSLAFLIQPENKARKAPRRSPVTFKMILFSWFSTFFPQKTPLVRVPGSRRADGGPPPGTAAPFSPPAPEPDLTSQNEGRAWAVPAGTGRCHGFRRGGSRAGPVT